MVLPNIQDNKKITINSIFSQDSEQSFVPKRPLYYYRQWENDFSRITTITKPSIDKPQDNSSLLIRSAKAAIPLLSLYNPLGKAISLVTNSMRGILCIQTFSTKNTSEIAQSTIQVILAVAALATTIFTTHPIAMMITTGHDIYINCGGILHGLQIQDYQHVLDNVGRIANNSLYLAIFFTGSLEIIVISFSAQILLLGYQSMDEFQEGRIVEGVSHILMATARVYQLHPQIEKLQCKWWDIDLYEGMVEKYLDKNYLHFIGDDEKEKFLILNAKSDHNEIFDPRNGNFLEHLKKLNERFDIRFHSVSTIEEINREIDLATQAGQVTGLMFRAHGNPFFIRFGSDCSKSFLTKKSLEQINFSSLDPDCTIVLDSCLVAKYPKNSIAYDISDAAQRTTYAADCELGSMDLNLDNLNPLEWSYGGEEKDLYHVRKISPNTPTATV